VLHSLGNLDEHSPHRDERARLESVLPVSAAIFSSRARAARAQVLVGAEARDAEISARTSMLNGVTESRSASAGCMSAMALVVLIRAAITPAPSCRHPQPW